MKGHCIKSLKLLLSCNIDNLHDDCFEGSVDESHIFRDVFFNHEDTNQNDNWSPKYISFRSDSDNSVMTSQLDSLQCTTSEEFASFTRNDPDVEVKKIKVSLSPLEHSITIPVKIPKPRWKDSSFIELEKDELTLPPNNSTMDPKPILRYYTYTLLKSSGWLIGRRNRTTHCKGRGEYVFKSPEGRPIREFYRAWNMCGQTLVKDADYKTLRDDINWNDLTQFQSDLSIALTKVKELVDSVIVTDLAHSWYLLDPFAKLVFIDKRLSLLKEGKEVKAKRSLVNGLYSKNKKPKKEKKEKCCIKDDDLLMSAIFTRKRNRSTLTKKNSPVLKVVKKYNNALGVTTVLSWLIKLGVIHVNEVIQYRDPHDDTVVKHGLVKQNGILCGCCKKLLCVSEFKNHVNFSIENTSLNLYMQSGKSFTLCQLEAWSTEYKVRKNATRTVQVAVDHFDDSCGLCGDGGELVCCDNCPSTFHQTCLSTQELPEGNWYCSNCCCWSCGDVINHIEASESYNSLKCLQCEHKYHLECVEGNGIEGGSVGPTWFCGETCKKIHWSLRSQIGCRNPLSDGFSWTLLKCIHGEQKVNSNPAFIALKAECNLKLAVALTIMEECFLPMVDTRTGIYMIPHVVYNWGSEFVRLNYEGFYTMVLEKNDILLCVASIRIHGTTVAEMPLIGTCTKYRRQGMCRRLMNAIEQMLKLFKVETLVVSAIPSLVDTWTGGFGFLRLEDDEKKSLGKTNLMVFPGTVWLKKPMYQDILTGMSSSSHKT